jgi:hypothetical protein
MGQNGRWNTEFGIAPGLGVDPRRGQQQFARIDKD